MSAAPVLVATGLTRRFGDRVAVDNVSFRIDPGETYGLLGPNGAGKSTTIAMVCGLLRADAGTITVAGTEIRPGRVAGKSAIGLVPQEVAVYPELTAQENLDFFARLQGMSRAARRARIDEVVEVIGLAERRGDKVTEFSGGMKRRLNIGIGLLHRPQLLVLDEPTVGVDPQSRSAILAAVESLAATGMAVLYTTHYMEEAERLCERVGIIDNGMLLVEGTTDELIASIGGQETIRVAITGPAPVDLDSLRALPGVTEVGMTEVAADERSLGVLVDSASQRLGALIEALTTAEIPVGSIEIDRADLEAVFLHLTGRALRR